MSCNSIKKHILFFFLNYSWILTASKSCFSFFFFFKVKFKFFRFFIIYNQILSYIENNIPFHRSLFSSTNFLYLKHELFESSIHSFLHFHPISIFHHFPFLSFFFPWTYNKVLPLLFFLSPPYLPFVQISPTFYLK